MSRQRFVPHTAAHTANAIQSVIVKHNQFAVARFLNVDFDEIDAQCERGADGGKGVLQITSTEAAMRDDQRRFGHGRLCFHSST